MAIYSHLETFAGKKVQLWQPGQALADPASTIHHLVEDSNDEQSMVDRFHTFVHSEGAHESTGLVIGAWGKPYKDVPVDLAKVRLPKLSYIAIGE